MYNQFNYVKDPIVKAWNRWAVLYGMSHDLKDPDTFHANADKYLSNFPANERVVIESIHHAVLTLGYTVAKRTLFDGRQFEDDQQPAELNLSPEAAEVSLEEAEKDGAYVEPRE